MLQFFAKTQFASPNKNGEHDQKIPYHIIMILIFVELSALEFERIATEHRA